MSTATNHKETTMPETPKGKRLTLTEIVESQMAFLGRATADRSTVKLARNAKGDVQIEVRVAIGETEVDTVEQAAAKAQAMFDELAARYPLPEPPEAPAEPEPEPEPEPKAKPAARRRPPYRKTGAKR